MLSLTEAQSAAPNPPAASIIANGDFQTDSKQAGWPDGWGSKAAGDGKTWEIEDGRHFMRLISQQPDQLQLLYREVNLKPGEVKGLSLTVRYRTHGLKSDKTSSSSARAVFFFKNKAGILLDPPPEPLLFSGDADGWNEVTEQVLVPRTATRMVLMVGLFHAKAGTVDIGSIIGSPLTEADASKLAAAIPPAVAAQPSWVTNGDFEKSRPAGDWPLDWESPVPGMSWLQEEGKHFVRIISQKPGVSLMLGRAIPLQGDAHGLVLFIRYRATGIEHGDHEWFDSRTIVHFLDIDGRQLANEGRDLDVVFTHKPAPTGWVDVARFLAVPEGAKALQIRSGLFQVKAGMVDLAEIRVTAVTDADTELLKTASAAYISWKGDINAEMDKKAETQIQAQLAATGSLIPNGSFELATLNPTWPDGWGREPAPGLSWEKENGKRFLRLTAQTPPRVVMLYKMVLLSSGLKAVDLSMRYRMSGFAQGDTTPGDARMPFHFLDGTRVGHLENGKELKPDLAEFIFSPSAAAWTEIHLRLLVPVGATKLQIMPALWNVKAGILDLADLRVTPLSDAGAATSGSGRN